MGIFNKSFRKAVIPEDWKDTNILPGKDKKFPSSYRPISLLACMAKLMEKIIARRLQWYMEQNNLLTSHQFGFRPARSTVDPLILIGHEIQMVFRKKATALMVCFDIISAFDWAAPSPILYISVQASRSWGLWQLT